MTLNCITVIGSFFGQCDYNIGNPPFLVTMFSMSDSKFILVTGATGYVGGRLVPRLLEAGYRIRCLVRDPSRLQGRPWLKRVEVISGDALTSGALTDAMKDVSVAYYLIHGKQGGQINAQRDLD